MVLSVQEAIGRLIGIDGRKLQGAGALGEGRETETSRLRDRVALRHPLPLLESRVRAGFT